VKAALAKIDAPIVSNQVLASASAAFSWAIREEVGGVLVNPCHGVQRNETTDRERVLSKKRDTAILGRIRPPLA
jgi:hypothetical protein